MLLVTWTDFNGTHARAGTPVGTAVVLNEMLLSGVNLTTALAGYDAAIVRKRNTNINANSISSMVIVAFAGFQLKPNTEG
jgi:hypothetical protein